MNWTYILATAATVVFVGWAGNSDYELELLEERAYIEKVCTGQWGDYKQLGENLDCSSIDPEKML